ncbi:hypothetical protein HY969_02945 [Candidatus Kaiserbacteria bacterium]|nr:hypothetical protein [Candidatus Kaiserbacteria bacterium]
MNEKTDTSVQDVDRRDFLRILGGAGAFTFASLHSTLLRALESLNGKGWRDGILDLQRAAKDAKNEYGGVFIGSRSQGRWYSGGEGDRTGIEIDYAKLLREVFTKENRKNISEGLAIYHTHQDAGTLEHMARYFSIAGVPEERVRQAVDFYLTPSTPDLVLAQQDGIGYILRKMGMKTIQIEDGVVTSRFRWVLKKMKWDAKEREQYPAEYKHFQLRETLLNRIIRSLQQAFLKNIADVRKFFPKVVEDWKHLAKTPSEFADVLANLVARGVVVLNEPHWIQVYAWAKGLPLRDDIEAYQYLDVHSQLNDESRRLTREILAGTRTFEGARDAFKQNLLKLGLELQGENLAPLP